MSETGPIEKAKPSTSSAVAELSPTDAALLWRGQCLALMARAEGMVGSALVALLPSDAVTSGYHLTTPRFKGLERLLAERDGASNILKAVERYRRWHELRRFLCHGEMHTQTLADGTWFATFTMIRLDDDQPRRALRVVSSVDADQQHKALSADTQRVVALLRPLATAMIALEGSCAVGGGNVADAG